MSKTHNHNHNHDHCHTQDHHAGHHDHHHGLPDLSKMSPEKIKATMNRIRWALILNMSFAIIELVGGLWVNSLAILSGALHDFGDSLALGLAYFLEKKSHQKSDPKYSYGYRRFSTLAALMTGSILVAGSVIILYETIPRLWSADVAPKAQGMVALALLGLLVNAVAALRIAKGSSLSEKMLLWHLLEDVMGWSLVLVGGIVLSIWQISWLDPVLALVLSVWVIRNVLKNLRQAVDVFLQAVPSEINIEKLIQKMTSVEFVRDIHHVHVWTLDGEAHVLTAHVSLHEGLNFAQWDAVKTQIKHLLWHEGIAESTLEFEDGSQVCSEPHHDLDHDSNKP